ncbi:MAG: hypothetical protein MUP09_10440 [Thiovulaceae bacterium]|nr:hypothetical protein [Sulfurimonadaceae bacterium]
MQKMLICFALFLTISSFSEVWAEGFDVGAGFALVNPGASEGSDRGLDIALGYELPEMNKWNFGAQLHLIHGLTSRSDVEEERAHGFSDSSIMSFDSQALYLTVRPEDWWVQFNAGIVHADYHTVEQDVSSTGAAVGIGIMVGSGDFRLHMFDVHRYQIGGESFYIYSFSIFLVPGAL